jgi:alpha-1,6-mannosyltransferase
MKICDITNFYSPQSGGVKTYLNYKRDFIRSSGGEHEHILIVPGRENREAADGPCRLYQIKGHVPFWEKNYRFITDFAAIQEIILVERPDIIEIGSPYLVPWAVRRVARRLNIGLVGFFHSNFPATYVRPLTERLGERLSGWCENAAWRYARLVYNWCDAVVAASSFSGALLPAKGIRNVYKIPFGVDTDVFSPHYRDEALKSELGLPPGATILLYVGRITAEKDLSTLIQAFEILKRRGDFAAILLGAGPAADRIKEAAGRIGGLRYLGYKRHDDGLPRLYASADIVVAPSPNETFGLSLLEALASGLPVVAVNGGAASELASGRIGEAAEPHDPDSLADAVLRLAGRLDPQLRKECREYAAVNFSWEKTFGSLMELYESILSARSK